MFDSQVETGWTGSRPDRSESSATVQARTTTPVARLRSWLLADEVRVPLAVFALSRLYVFFLGAIAMYVGRALPPVPALGYTMPPLYGWAHYLLQPWRNWDGHWYTLIAKQGYEYDRAVTAFYPLYPLLLRAGAWLLDGQIELAGVLLSNLFFLGALTILYRLLKGDFSAELAKRALLYLALFPTAYYFSAVYSESLFLFLAAGAFLAARRDQWWLAGAAGFLASLTRIHGVLLLLPLTIMFLRQQGWRPRGWRANPTSLLLVPTGLLAYMAYLRRVWGDPFVMVRVQKEWERYSSNPLQTLYAGFNQINGCALRDWNVGVTFCWPDQLWQHPSIATIRDFNWRWAISESNFFEFFFTVLLLLLTLAAFRLVPLAYSSYLAAGVVLPLWSPSSVHALMSMHRFALILFPAFVVLALAGRWRPVHALIMVASAALMALFVNQFATWLWVA